MAMPAKVLALVPPLTVSAVSLKLAATRLETDWPVTLAPDCVTAWVLSMPPLAVLLVRVNERPAESAASTTDEVLVVVDPPAVQPW